MLRCFAVFLLGALTAVAAERVPLVRAHAHNDYEHTRPLLDALDAGFANVEADVWLVDGKLLVAHNAKDVKPERTLEALYLDPLRERARKNGGRVFRGGPTITLLIDAKSEAVTTYAVLHAVLERYADIMTAFRDGKAEARAVTAIVSGNRAIAEMTAQSLRYAAIDGRSGDLEKNPPASLVPWVSENWQKLSTWKWEGAMPEKDQAMLRAFVMRAHEQGRKVRFWNTPDRPDAWRLLLDAGVDIIGTDHLTELADFYSSDPGRK